MGSRLVGYVNLLLWSKPDGLESGNMMILVPGVYKYLRAYKIAVGPRY